MNADAWDAQRLEMAARLKEAREYLGLSQEEVATALNIPRPAISRIESGERKVEALELEQFSKLYTRSVQYFLSGETPDDELVGKVAFAARALKGLSDKDLEEVARFASFLRVSGAKNSKGRK
ncbi:helix-turn-helix transcriptional regulator [Variovorax paradoxus]|uniref:helix-turn-helix domain-containing protein n=1 Tax=Variovorax paradoxus TaxID=34073 RepID=UPI0021ABFEFA|nr:helix-turn-helix transcriptional regulator [Variovorax paradoxus]UVH57182.1 helix-turn-helix transcriptional regulator [Variovorax paradoxus]